MNNDMKVYEYHIKQQERYELLQSGRFIAGIFMLITFVYLFVGSVFTLVTGSPL